MKHTNIPPLSFSLSYTHTKEKTIPSGGREEQKILTSKPGRQVRVPTSKIHFSLLPPPGLHPGLSFAPPGQDPVLSHARDPRDRVGAKTLPPPPQEFVRVQIREPGALEADKTHSLWSQETQGKIETVCLD